MAGNKKKYFTTKRMHSWHGWLGFKLSIMMFVICFTGSLAVVSHELDWLIDPMLRVEAEDKPINWQGMQASFKERYPHARLASIKRPLYSNFSSIGVMYTANEEMRRVFLNPYSGEVIGDRAWYASSQRILRDFHRYMLYPVGGIYVVGPFSLVLLGSLITGILSYKKFWRGFFKFRVNKGRRIFWGDFHKVSALWSLWLVLTISITGIWYLVEAIVDDVGVDIQMARPELKPESSIDDTINVPFVRLPDVLETVRFEMPDLEIKNVVFPANERGYYYLNGQRPPILVRNRSNHIFMDPYSGAIVMQQRTEDKTLFERWIDTADPLHFGNFGGLAVKIIWFIFGLLVSGLILTGGWLWLQRVARYIEADGSLARAHKMWVFKPLSIALITVGVVVGGGIILNGIIVL